VLYDVFDGDTLAAQARTTLVTFDFDTDRPRRLTTEERAILDQYTDRSAESAGDTADAAATRQSAG